MSVYLDYNASAPIDKKVLECMIEIYSSTIGNPDSRTHDYGERARSVVENARKQVAELLSVDSTEVFFTSGATESNNIAIQGLREYAEATGRKHIITTAIEHKAVLETVKYLGENGFGTTFVSPDKSGRIDPNKILDAIKPETLLVSVMHVNNETGIIQPVDVIGNRLKDTGVLFHVDATQSCGKLVEEIKCLDYDMLSFSAHKLGGPQGVGVLILKRKNGKRLPVKPVLYGGQQENGIRPGTVPVALVAGCGKACEIALKEYSGLHIHNQEIKDAIMYELDSSGVRYTILGDPNYCVSSTINVAINGVVSEALMLCTKDECAISNGSACTSKSYSFSYVLKAMGIAEELISSAIRISWGKQTELNDIQVNFRALLARANDMVN